MISSTAVGSPFVKEGEHLKLNGVALFSCGCGGVTARWATIAQNFITNIPRIKPKSSRPITEWMRENGLFDKYPEFKGHTYGMVVAETDKGIEAVNIMGGTTKGVVTKVADLIRRHDAFTSDNQPAGKSA